MATVTAHEISADRFDDMLGALPPAVHDGKGFLLGEAHSHNRAGKPLFSAFLEIGGKFYECEQVMTADYYRALSLSEITIV